MTHVFVSIGDDVPDPGLSTARALTHSELDLSLTAVSRAPHGPARHAEVFDAVWTLPSWDDLSPDAHAEALSSRMASDDLYLPTAPAEAHWLADADPSTEGILSPPAPALSRTTAPALEGADALPVSVPEWISLSAPVEDLHAFGRRHGWALWMRAPLGPRQRLGHWQQFDRVYREMAGHTPDAEALVLQRAVDGVPLRVSFAAHEGTLLGAALVRPTSDRGTYDVSAVPDSLRSSLAERLNAWAWTGGGSLELIEDSDGTWWLDTWRPCFGTAVAGLARSGTALPTRLVAAATGGIDASPAPPSGTVADPTLSLAIGRSPEAPGSNGTPSPPATPPLPSTAVPPSSEDDARSLTADLQAIIDDLPDEGAPPETPRSILLPTRTQDRFKAFTDAADRVEAAFDLETARIGLSIKTNPADALLQTAREVGMLAETIHRDEMAHAREHGYDTNEIIVNGPVQALLPELDTAPYALFGDAVKDLTDLPFDPSGAIVGVRTRPPERGESRFGVDLSEPARMERLCEQLLTLPADTRIGLHLHAPSSTLGHDQWWASVRRVLQWAETIQARTGRAVECLDLGGGWHPDDWLDVFIPGLLDRRALIREALPDLTTLLLEPGKALSQPLGVVVSRVLDVRPSRSEVILDASLAELANIDYHPHRLLAHTDDRGWHRLPRGEGRLLGRLCMEADILGRRRHVSHLSAGDRIVLCDAGAYDASMTYPFGQGRSAAA